LDGHSDKIGRHVDFGLNGFSNEIDQDIRRKRFSLTGQPAVAVNSRIPILIAVAGLDLAS
jgi:hypothetical protein